MTSERRTRIAEIRQLLQSGITSMDNDGQRATFDLESLRRELRQLEEQEGVRPRRAKVSNIFLG